MLKNILHSRLPLKKNYKEKPQMISSMQSVDPIFLRNNSEAQNLGKVLRFYRLTWTTILIFHTVPYCIPDKTLKITNENRLL